MKRLLKIQAMNAVLTERENEIAYWLISGYAKKTIADKLFISIRTVDKHCSNIYHKTGVQKISELCIWYFKTHYGISLAAPGRKTFAFLLMLMYLFL